MSQGRLDSFLAMVKTANTKFTESRSCLKSLLALMRQQVKIDTYNLGALTASIASARNDKRGAKYENALQYVERVWGKGTLEYKGPNQAVFANYSGRIYVLRNTQITFREVDTGTQRTQTFQVNSASADPAGEVTANIQFSATSSYSVKAIVFELRANLTFADPFNGRSDNDLGVNEHMTLDFVSTPLGVTAAQAGDLLWTIDGAIPANADSARQLFGKLQRASGNVAAPIADGKAYFIAPWATDSASPLAPKPSKRSSVSTLKLTIQNGPSQGMSVTRVFTVHTPVARMVATPPWQHVTGRPSAGFTGDIYFDPKNVSFQYVKFQEGRGTMVAKQTGFMGAQDMRLGAPPRQLPSSPSGYFAWEGTRVHAHTPIWVDISRGDSTNGCKLVGSDNVYTAPNPLWPARYDGTYGEKLRGKETNVPSELTWPIYWRYKADDIAQGVVSQQVKHHSTMDASGTVVTEKAGARVSRLLNDPSA
jgi:hypothetical protein